MVVAVVVVVVSVSVSVVVVVVIIELLTAELKNIVVVALRGRKDYPRRKGLGSKGLGFQTALTDIFLGTHLRLYGAIWLPYTKPQTVYIIPTHAAVNHTVSLQSLGFHLMIHLLFHLVFHSWGTILKPYT